MSNPIKNAGGAFIFAALIWACLVAHELWTDDYISESYILGELGWWLAAALIILFVTQVEKRPLSSIGLKAPAPGSLGVAAIAFSVAVFLVGIFSIASQFLGVDFTSTQENLQGSSSAPFWVILLSLTRAGIVEELLFRGFFLSRSVEAGAPHWAALLLSTGLFVAPHFLFWGGAHLIIVVAAGLAFGTVFLWKRDLAACVLAHIGFNLFGVVAVSLT